MPVFVQIQLSERANIADANYLYGELTQEIYYFKSLRSQYEVEDEWSDQWRQQLFK